MPPEFNLPLLLPVIRAAEVSGISRSEIYRMIADGRLTAKRVGAAWRIKTVDLFAAVEALPQVGG